MNVRENVFIFSVCQASVSETDNEMNHKFVKDALTFSNVGFKEILSMYKGNMEKGFTLVGLKNEDMALTYCQVFKQECYLMIHNDRAAELKVLTKDGIKSEKIGRFIPVPDSVNVKDLTDYVKDLSSGGYWYVVNN